MTPEKILERTKNWLETRISILSQKRDWLAGNNFGGHMSNEQIETIDKLSAFKEALQQLNGGDGERSN